MHPESFDKTQIYKNEKLLRIVSENFGIFELLALVWYPDDGILMNETIPHSQRFIVQI
jgi:hypothetical protein